MKTLRSALSNPLTSSLHVPLHQEVKQKPVATNRLRIAPFLKWAGGKRQLVPALLERMPDLKKVRYHEPFVGGGALFFALAERNLLGPKKAYLSDLNADLVCTYQVVRDQISDLVDLLRCHRNEEEYFYQIRALDPQVLTPVERAARMIYLNKTCFNGLFRENQKGRFNVPFGYYVNPSVCNTDVLYAAHVVLQDVRIEQAGFEAALDNVKEGDFVYFDPPYVPLSTTSSFVGYQAQGFSTQDHLRLAEVGQQLAARGVNVMISNSAAPLTRTLYGEFSMEEIEASRSISSSLQGRKKVKELLLCAGPHFEGLARNGVLEEEHDFYPSAKPESSIRTLHNPFSSPIPAFGERQ